MLIHRQISRRDVLRAALVSGATLAVPGWAFAQRCRQTPHQDEGPFYLNSISKAEQKRLIIEPSCGPGSNTENQYVFHVALKPFRART